MTEKRDLTLSPRKENLRTAQPIAVPVHFSLDDIINHFTESMTAIKDQFTVADDLMQKGNDEGCRTIWRSQVVLSEGLMDFYIHEISKFCRFRMFAGLWNKTEKYMNLLIPMKKVEEGISAAIYKDWFYEYLNSRFSREVFLSYESIHDQLNLIGIEFKAVMSKAFAKNSEAQSIKAGKKVIEELFKRRNEIAHQNDRNHADAVQNNITKEFVDDYISKIEAIVYAIHEIATKIETESITKVTSP